MSFMINCPNCGRRNAYEFRFGGEDRGPRPEEAGLTSKTWCEVVHLSANVGGVQKEWWCHRDGCGLWFSIWRNTLTNLEVDKAEAES